MRTAIGTKWAVLAAAGCVLAAPALASHDLKGGQMLHAEHGGCVSVVTVSKPVHGLTVTRAAPQGEGCDRAEAHEAGVEVETDVDVNVTVIAPRTIRGGTSRCALGAPCDEYRWRDTSGAYALGAPQPKSR